MGQIPSNNRAISLGVVGQTLRGRRESKDREVEHPVPIMDINNIHTELPWKLGSKG